MLFRTRVWGAGKLLVLAAALLGTFVIFAAAAMRVALRAREVKVPDLAGRTVQDATAILDDHGLTLRVDEVQRADPKVPAGHITQQEPAP
jgi:beta-lactam-binding protein with PASTA domain